MSDANSEKDTSGCISARCATVCCCPNVIRSVLFVDR